MKRRSLAPGCDDQFEFEFSLDLLLDGEETTKESRPSTHTTDTTDHQGAEHEPDGSGGENEAEAKVAAAGHTDEYVTGLIQEVEWFCGEAGAKGSRKREGDVPQSHIPTR